MPWIVILFLNLFLQILAYALHIEQIFGLNQTKAGLSDYIYFLSYTCGIFLLLRPVISLPFTLALRAISEKWGVVVFILWELVFNILAVAECKFYLAQGLHLYDKVVIDTIQNPTFSKEVNLGLSTYLTVAAIFVLMAFLEYQLFFWLKRRRPFDFLITPKRIFIGLSTVTFLIYQAVTSYLPKKGEIANIYPFYSAIKGHPGQHPIEAKYAFPENSKGLPPAQQNVFFTMAESFRSDMIATEFTPKLLAEIEDLPCWFSKSHYSGGHTTEYGVFSALYGIHAFHFEIFKRQGITPLSLKFLKEKGMKLIAGTASGLKQWNESGFMFQDFDEYKEFNSVKHSKIHEDDPKMIKWILNQIELNRKNKSFYFMFFNSTHHNYYYSSKFRKFSPTVGLNFNHVKEDTNSERFRVGTLNRYKNSIGYVDEHLSGLIKKLRSNILAGDIFIFTGDHGEEFWEHGLFGHAKTSYINERTRVPLLLCSSKLKEKSPNFSAHVDLMPIIFELLGHTPPDIFSGFPLSTLNRETRPYTIVSPPQFPLTRNKIGIIDHKYKYWLKKSGKEISDLYMYKSTDHDDKVVVSKESRQELQKRLNEFKVDAFKFLKPSDKRQSLWKLEELGF